MPITVAKSAGFCYGVANAVNSTDELLEKCGTTVNSLGPIIHNEYIINRLTERGVKVIDSPQEADENSTVIIRAHGVGEEVVKENIW
jgi:4-hydroxy-3-methylbut-2-enyl diphosphate reductase